MRAQTSSRRSDGRPASALRTIFSLMMFAILLCLLSVAVGAQEQRVALVIGNGQYQHVATLVNPPNDAADMAAALKKDGFSVTLLTDASRKAMDQAVRAFGNSLKNPEAVGLFYYSGHGAQADGENFLIPVDADIQAADELGEEAVNAESILAKMRSAANKLNIVVMDACRDNPFPGASRSAEKGLAVVREKVPESVVVYATDPGSTASDGKGRNSPFTKAFLENMDAPGQDITEMMKRVTSRVRTDTDGKQTPWVSTNLTKDFSFVATSVHTSLVVSVATAGTVEVAEKKLQIAAGDTLRIPDIAPGDYVLKVTYDDGKTESRPATLEGSKSLSVSFAYQRGALAVSVKTAGTLEVAGKKLPIAAGDTLPVKDLAPGDYVLKVTYDDGKTESRPVTVEGGKSLDVSFDYQQGALAVSLKTTGTLEVAGKKLQIAAGDTLPVRNLAPGDYVLKVTYDDGKTESRPVTVEGGKSLNVSFEYQRGALTVSVATTGTVEVAGKKLQIAAGDTTIVSDLSPGDYLLRVTYDDGKTESGAVTVEGGKRAQVSFAYKPGANQTPSVEPAKSVLPPSTLQGGALPHATISMDGSLDDWQNILPVVTSQNAPDSLGISKVFLAANSKDFYVRFDIKANKFSRELWQNYGITIDNGNSQNDTGWTGGSSFANITLTYGNYFNWQGHWDQHGDQFNDGIKQWMLQLGVQKKGTYQELARGTVGNSVVKGSSAEIRIPLDKLKEMLKGLGPTDRYRVYAWTSSGMRYLNDLIKTEAGYFSF